MFHFLGLGRLRTGWARAYALGVGRALAPGPRSGRCAAVLGSDVRCRPWSGARAEFGGRARGSRPASPLQTAHQGHLCEHSFWDATRRARGMVAAPASGGSTS